MKPGCSHPSLTLNLNFGGGSFDDWLWSVIEPVLGLKTNWSARHSSTLKQDMPGLCTVGDNWSHKTIIYCWCICISAWALWPKPEASMPQPILDGSRRDHMKFFYLKCITFTIHYIQMTFTILVLNNQHKHILMKKNYLADFFWQALDRPINDLHAT